MTASEEAEEPIGKTWWLPHHAVINPNKPGKVRVVFDAAAKFHGVSLNEAFLKGSDLLTSLVRVLIRFRQFPIAVSADIVKMYHQVRVPEEDCSALRFLWRNPGSGDKIRTHQMKVQIFGAVSSPTICAYALRQAASDSESDVPFAVTQVINNFYVDNWLTSFKTLEQAINAADIMTRMLAKVGFELAQWGSSSRQVLHGRLKGDAAIDLDLDQLPTERTLGLWWNSSTDEFNVRFKVESSGNTKREILRMVSHLERQHPRMITYSASARLACKSICRVCLKPRHHHLFPQLLRFKRSTSTIRCRHPLRPRHSPLPQKYFG